MIIKEEIYLRRVIVHILDSNAGMPVLADKETEYGADLAEFLKEHIARVDSGDECKECEFHKEQSEIYQMLSGYQEEDFVTVSKDVASLLYEILSSNPDIPSADFFVVRFGSREHEYLALLKMNYKESYTHRTMAGEDGNSNEIFLYRALLPTLTQRVTEAAIIDLADCSVRLVEKKYEVNGEKTNYFSYLFLKCAAHMSHKTKLALVARAVESVQNEAFEEERQYEEHMRAKSIINETLAEQGSFGVEEIAQKIFEETPTLIDSFEERMEKYDMVKETVRPQSEKTIRKYEKQCLMTDTGIEIKIPMDQYRDPGSVEFITNEDGTVSVYIKNIGHLTARF